MAGGGPPSLFFFPQRGGAPGGRGQIYPTPPGKTRETKKKTITPVAASGRIRQSSPRLLRKAFGNQDNDDHAPRLPGGIRRPDSIARTWPDGIGGGPARS